MSKSRRQFSADQKMSILRENLIDKVAISDICDKHGIQPSIFYEWQKKLFENGEAILARGRREPTEKKLSKQIDALNAKLKRKDEVIAEIMEEHVALKKVLGEN
ncbi:MAG: transposase [Mariprofundaceae bacterium]